MKKKLSILLAFITMTMLPFTNSFAFEVTKEAQFNDVLLESNGEGNNFVSTCSSDNVSNYLKGCTSGGELKYSNMYFNGNKLSAAAMLNNCTSNVAYVKVRVTQGSGYGRTVASAIIYPSDGAKSLFKGASITRNAVTNLWIEVVSTGGVATCDMSYSLYVE